MRKIIILSVLISLSLSVSAQISFGVRGGMDLSSYSAAKSDYLFKPGFHVGAIIDFPLSNSNFSFVSGLYIADKGTKAKGNSNWPDVETLVAVDDYTYKETRDNYQLEIPLLIAYRIPLTKNISLKPQFGAFFSYTLFGNTKTEYNYTNTGRISNVSSNDYASDGFYSIGANAGLSVFYNKFSFTYSCDLGYSNETRLETIITSNLSNYPDICMFFSLGYNF
jgi:hypothetical protein